MSTISWTKRHGRSAGEDAVAELVEENAALSWPEAVTLALDCLD